MLGDPLEAHLDAHAVDVHLVAVGTELADAERVARATVAQVDRLAHLRLGMRAAAAGERVELRAVGGGGGVAQRDRRAQQGDVGVARGLDVARALQAVEPARVDLAGAQLGAAEQLEQEALVRRPLVDHRPACRRARGAAARSPRARVAPWAMIFAIIESNSGGTVSPSATPVSTRTPGPLGSRRQRDPAGGGREAARRVLGVQARLDGVAARRRRVALEPPAGGDVQLQLDEVGAGDRLGDRVLHLQPRVDLHEREALALGLVEELDRAGAAVAGQLAPAATPPRRSRAPARRRAPGWPTPRRPSGGGAGSCSRARRAPTRPPWPSAISCTSTWRARATTRSISTVGSPKLCAASSRARSNAAAQVLGALDAAHAAAAAAGRGLDHQRVADRLAVTRDRVVGVLDRPAAPRRHGHASLLGELLGRDLVAERAHDARVGPGEDDVEPLAQLGEARVLGDEAPADPGGVRAGRRQRALERLVVEVGASCGGRPGRSTPPGRGSAPRRPGARTARGARRRCRAR